MSGSGFHALGLADHIVEQGAYDRTVGRLREARILMPTFAELADPRRIPAPVASALAGVKARRAAPAEPVPCALVRRVNGSIGCRCR
jgi:hypothetical protein